MYHTAKIPNLLFPERQKIVTLLKVSAFDLIILAILAALTLRGIWKGMVSQIVSVASFFVCWIVASRFGSLVAPTIPVEAPWNQVAAMAIIFLITMIALRFASAALEKLIRNWRLAKLNSLLGGALGFVKGLLICMIITFFAVMFSETSRNIVFNSKTGTHLVQLITQMSVFVPKDSYEFVHAQLAQFQNQVEKAVPGQTPETVLVQNSETVQQMLTRLQQTKAEAEKPATGSLWSAVSKWWSGSKENPAETVSETLSSTPLMVQNSTSSLPPTASYTPPSLPADTYVAAPQPAVTKPAAAEEFFVRSSTLPATQPLTSLLPSTPEVSGPTPSSPLTTLAPLTELLPIPSELEHQLLPTSATPHHVGSDQLLHNSTRITNPTNSAKVFRSQ